MEAELLMALKRAHLGLPRGWLEAWQDLSHFRVRSNALKSGLFFPQAVNSALDDTSQHLFLKAQPVAYAWMSGKGRGGFQFLPSLPAQPGQKEGSGS